VSRVSRPREYDDDLRIRLIEVAARLLADEGPAAVTTRRVAAEVGTSTTAIYSLVGSKDDLMQAVSVEGFVRLARHLDTVERSDDAGDDLARLGDAYFDMAVENPWMYRVMFDQPGLHRLTEDNARASLQTLQTLVDAVQRGIDEGILGGDAFTVALQLWSVSHGIAGLAITGVLGAAETARVLQRSTRDAVVRGLHPAAAGGPHTPSGVHPEHVDHALQGGGQLEQLGRCPR
jgi:AcrR family transcriptional regulator